MIRTPITSKNKEEDEGIGTRAFNHFMSSNVRRDKSPHQRNQPPIEAQRYHEGYSMPELNVYKLRIEEGSERQANQIINFIFLNCCYAANIQQINWLLL